MAAVVYIVILAMWAAVLIPMWARHRDQSRSLRSVDDFRRALTTLSDDPQMQQLLPVSDAMGRRRKVYSSLLGLFILTTVLWIAHVVPAEWLLFPLGLMAGFTVAARKQVLAENRRRDAAIRYWRSRTRCMAVHPSGQAVRPHVKAAGVRVEPVAARPAVRFDDGAEAAPVVARNATWAAQPLTLPTYVTAPAATAVPRQLDADGAQGWDRARMLQLAEDQRRARSVSAERNPIDEFMERTTGAHHDRDEVFDQYASDNRAVANG